MFYGENSLGSDTHLVQCYYHKEKYRTTKPYSISHPSLDHLGDEGNHSRLLFFDLMKQCFFSVKTNYENRSTNCSSMHGYITIHVNVDELGLEFICKSFWAFNSNTQTCFFVFVFHIIYTENLRCIWGGVDFYFSVLSQGSTCRSWNIKFENPSYAHYNLLRFRL